MLISAFKSFAPFVVVNFVSPYSGDSSVGYDLTEMIDGCILFFNITDLLPMSQYDEPFGNLIYMVNIMGNEYDGYPLSSQLLYELHNLSRFLHGEKIGDIKNEDTSVDHLSEIITSGRVS